MNFDVFEHYESAVRSYCRAFPVTFNRAKGSYLYSSQGDAYLDFFVGAGSLSFGHNHPPLKQAVMDYLAADGILHGLDMFTEAKQNFLRTLHESILQPLGLEYRTQFTGPTGTNAVEAALKLARKVKRRTNVFAFQGGYHGMTAGSLAATGNKSNRGGAGQALPNVTFMPFAQGQGGMPTFDTIEYMRALLQDPNSGIETPAAVIVETVQAEGGVMVAEMQWLQRLRQLCDEFDMLMIIDDIQVGCGRTGEFFSFTEAAIQPDMITLSKAISGLGLPLALLLLKPELDIWTPGEHNGTFRGNQLAFVAATEMLQLWQQQDMPAVVAQQATLMADLLHNKIASQDERILIRGRGMIWGIDLTQWQQPELVEQLQRFCFENNLIVENCGRHGQVIKLLPPLNITADELRQGCEIIATGMQKLLAAS